MTTDDRLDALRRKLRARQGIPAYRESCAAIQVEIERLEALQKGLGSE